MESRQKVKERVSVLILDEHSRLGHELFNINSWSGKSKQIIQSCITQINLLNYEVNKIKCIVESDMVIKQQQVQSQLNEQWEKGKWPIENCDIFIELPQLHMYIQGILSSGKSYLDIINAGINGFHKDNNIPGGRILKMLESNVVKHKEKVATDIKELLFGEKAKWIDDLIVFRDNLVHPEISKHQIMIVANVIENENVLKITKMNLPKVGNTDILSYGIMLIESIRMFSTKYIILIKS